MSRHGTVSTTSVAILLPALLLISLRQIQQRDISAHIVPTQLQSDCDAQVDLGSSGGELQKTRRTIEIIQLAVLAQRGKLFDRAINTVQSKIQCKTNVINPKRTGNKTPNRSLMSPVSSTNWYQVYFPWILEHSH